MCIVIYIAAFQNLKIVYFNVTLVSVIVPGFNGIQFLSAKVLTFTCAVENQAAFCFLDK